jgi:hypothetical protein
MSEILSSEVAGSLTSNEDFGLVERIEGCTLGGFDLPDLRQRTPGEGRGPV